MRITALVAALVLGFTTSANAVFVGFDVGANDTTLGANALVSDDGDFSPGPPDCDLSADVGLGSLAGGGADVDFYSVFVPSGCVLTAITTPLDLDDTYGFNYAPDTLLGVYDGAGILFGNDDGGTNYNDPTGFASGFDGSAIRLYNDGPGQTYYLGVTGYPDFNFNGFDDYYEYYYGINVPHGWVGRYLLTVSITPEPMALGVLGLGLLVLRRRR